MPSFARIDIDYLCTTFDDFRFSRSSDMIGTPKILMGHITWPRPIRDGLSSVGWHLRIQPLHQIWTLCDHQLWRCISLIKVRSAPAAADDHPHRRPPRTTTHAADRRGGRRCGWSSSRQRREGHCNGQVPDATFVTWNWSLCYLRVVDGMAAFSRRLAVCSGSFRRQMTVAESYPQSALFSNGGRRVGLCVFV